MLKSAYSAILLTTLTAACGSAPLSPAVLSRTAEAERRWAARPFGDYRYEVRHLCFCPPEVTLWSRVTVRAGVIAGVEPLDTNLTIAPDQWYLWPTVEALFAAIYSTAGASHLSEVVATFDGEIGYPRRIELRAAPNVEDAGGVFEARAVQPLAGR